MVSVGKNPVIKIRDRRLPIDYRHPIRLAEQLLSYSKAISLGWVVSLTVVTRPLIIRLKT